MTAEIAVINREAVALAADSAVTISLVGGNKIFTTVEKIFQVSEHLPVGFMVYNNAQFLGIPWETIISDFSKNIPETGFDTLEEYATLFLNYLGKGEPFISSSRIRKYARNYVSWYYSKLMSHIIEKLQEAITTRGSINIQSAQLIVARMISKNLGEWEVLQKDAAIAIPLKESKKIANHYRKEINDALDSVFENIPISKRTRGKLFKMAHYVISFYCNANINSGVVIVGFGEKEAFPSINSFTIEGIFKNKLKYYSAPHPKIDKDASGGIVPFAQREMVDRFMQGVDPRYQDIEKNFMSQIAEGFPELVTKKLKRYNTSEREALKERIAKECHNIFNEYRKRMEKEIQAKFIGPITNVVAVLPKSDLAMLANSLVSITSLKRRFSLERETVAEPIDVAIISKKDGFVWYKRK